MTSFKSFDQWFTKSASRIAIWSGSPSAVATAILLIAAWAVAGPFFGFSDFWQLTINTGTTIITFLMVFVIQNSQNREACAIQIKLDELIRATKAAHNSVIDLEQLTEADLEKFREHYSKLAEKARKREAGVIDDIAELTAEERAVELERRKEKRSRKHPKSVKAEA
ncbi:MAG: low affinity iron permease family protein [Hyphomicrobiales bacterium]